MNIRYKLTTQNMETYQGTQWKLNEWKETSGEGELCSEGWLHCYSNPLLAILLNAIHANITCPKLFEVEVEGENLDDNGLKEGWTRMRLVKELEVPEISLVQKVAFGILCTLEVLKEGKFVEWANDWLSGRDRTKSTAAGYAAGSGYAGGSAGYAAYVAAALSAGYAGYSAGYADRSAGSAARSAGSAAASAGNIDLVNIANKAITIK